MNSVYGVGHQPRSASAGGVGCFRFGCERAEIDRSTLHLNVGIPSSSRFIPTHSPIYRRPAEARVVFGLASIGDNAQVLTTVVQPVMVDVIYLTTIAGFQSHQLSMKANRHLLGRVPNGPDGISVRVKTPSIQIDRWSIGSVNQSIGSDAAVSSAQRDANGIIGTHQAPPGVRPGPLTRRRVALR